MRAPIVRDPGQEHAGGLRRQQRRKTDLAEIKTRGVQFVLTEILAVQRRLAERTFAVLGRLDILQTGLDERFGRDFVGFRADVVGIDEEAVFLLTGHERFGLFGKTADFGGTSRHENLLTP